METTKKVFVGSLHEFGTEARAQVVDDYRTFFPEGTAKPFISYDERPHLFSFTCERTDTTAVTDFFASMKGYVEVFEKKGAADYVDSSPKLKPRKGTLIEDTLILDDNEATGEDLLGIGDDVDSEVEEAAPGHGNPFWTPPFGNSHMLTRDIGMGVTEATEAELYPEHDRNRVTIMGGNASEALSKLTTLEPLMKLLAEQRKEGSTRPSSNVLMLPSLKELSTLDFKLVPTCPLAIERIVVDRRSQQYLERKCVTQVLHRDGRHGPYLAPDNLTEEFIKELATSTEGYAQIWAQQVYPTFGNPASAKPVEAFAAKMVSVMSPQKFVTASKAHDIGKWNEGIVDGVNPEEIAVEAPFETVPSQERKRMVRVDSDDDDVVVDESPEEDLLPSASRRVPQVDSDDEEESNEKHYSPSAVQQVPHVGLDDREAIIAGEAQSVAPLALVEASPPAFALRSSLYHEDGLEGGTARSQTRNAILYSDDKEEKAPSPILSPLPSQTMVQPTWTDSPFSRLEEPDDHERYGPVTVKTSEVPSTFGSGIPPEPIQSLLQTWESSDSARNLFDARSITQKAQVSFPDESGPHHANLESPLLEIDLLDVQASSPKFPSRNEVDPEMYGRSRRPNGQHGLDKGSGSRSVMTQGTTTVSRGMSPPLRGLSSASRGGAQSPRASLRGNSPTSLSGALNSSGRSSHPDQRPRDLVELSGSASSSGNVQPPPGLGIRVDTKNLISASPTDINLLDEPLENIQLASLKPMSASSEQVQEEPKSASTKKSSVISSRNSGVSWVNKHNPPRDIAKMEDESLARLMRMKEEQNKQKRLVKEAEAEANKHDLSAQKLLQNSSRNGQERKQKEDEISSRQLHNTMKQKAPKPLNNRKTGAKKMTDKERQQKINELLGETPATLLPPKSTPEINKMSTRKEQALKRNPELNPAAAAMLAEKQLSSRQTEKLIEYLNPLFEAGRAFRGELKFEIQLGQVLVAISKDFVTDEVQFVSKKKWESMFSPGFGSQQPPATSFTNTLTRNGHDVDRLLKIKPPRGSGGRTATPLFDELEPGPSEIVYEFHCQSKESEEFWIVVDATGKYRVRKSISAIGNVNLHYPAQIWDARAVLHGTADFCEPDEEIALIVASFMETVYVPAQKTLSITYRQPTNNEMTVRSVTVKRISLHSCNPMDCCEDMQLQVTEIKLLFHRFHQKDKKLSQSFEKDYQEMLDHDRIHYEICLVHKGINDALKQNQKLEIGTLTSDITTGKTLLKTNIIQSMLDLVSHVVSKIDWVGVHNNGTLVRMAQEHEHLQARVATTISPGTRPTPTLTGLAGTGVTRALESTVPGVRLNTLAEIGVDEDNKPVFIGYGGAKVPMKPLVEQDELNISAGEVVPNDSASNVGVNLKPMQHVAPASLARGQALRKGPDFW